MPGPPPTPTAIKILRGNPSHRPLNHDEPRFPPLGNLRPPPWLDPLARRTWRRFAPVLSEAGVLTAADADLFAAMCERWSTYRRAAEVVSRFGMTQTNKANGMVPRPEVGIAATALKQFGDIAAQFGLGAAARSRVRVAGGALPAKPESPTARFFGSAASG